MDDLQKLLIIGLDGATWDVLMPLIREGRLPILDNLIKNGSYGTLESIVPPVTGGAWVSMATGRNPGKTGIIDFLNRKDTSLKLYPTTSSDFKGHSFWDYLSRANKKVGIFNYPMLFPPYRVNGFMISGLGSSPHADISYPSSLKEELEQISGKYVIYVNYHSKKYDNLDLFLSHLNEFLDKFEKWIYYIVKKEWDFLFLVFSVTDWIQHIMWRHIDKNHPMYDPMISPKYKNQFAKFWQRIDKILGNILNLISEDTIVFLVSDHGFGSNDQTFNLAKWLIKKGYMVRRRSVRKFFKKYTYKFFSLIVSTPMGRIFPLRMRKSIGNILRTSIANEINFEKSKAYCLGHTIPFGAIYINAGNEKERKEMKDRLMRDLRNLSEDIGREVEVQIYEPKRIYFGKKVNLLPDIIFTINKWRCAIIEDDFDRPLFEERPFSIRHTGTHRLNGIFLAYGPGIRRCQKIYNARIYDIAPTTLYVFGLPIPNDMDGKILMNIFDKGSKFVKNNPKYVDPSYYAIEGEERLRRRINNLKLRGKIRGGR